MASTTFVDYNTSIVASWLNDVNTATYGGTLNYLWKSSGSSLIGSWTDPATITVGTATTAGNASNLGGIAAANYLLSSTAASTYGALSGTNPWIGINSFIDNNFIITGSSDATKKVKFEVDGNTTATTRTYTVWDRDLNLNLLSHGQCRLAKSGANLVLSPYNGNKLIINGTLQDVPNAGVSLAPPATTLTLYYIYAYMSGTTMTLEASTTAYATDANTGVMIKTGDATRTLVGMARTVTNAWVDTASQRFVRSWFNDSGITSFNTLTANVTNSTGTVIELNSSARAEFLSWSGELVGAYSNGYVSGVGAGNALTSIGIDSTTLTDALTFATVSASGLGSAVTSLQSIALSEGYHYMTLLGQNSAANMTWAGSGAAGSRCSITVTAKK